MNQELRAALSVEDWRKTEAQRDRESLLLAELVAIVDKRNELVQHLHNQEQAYVLNNRFSVFNYFSNIIIFHFSRIEDDDKIERELEHVDITAKEKCIIQ